MEGNTLNSAHNSAGKSRKTNSPSMTLSFLLKDCWPYLRIAQILGTIPCIRSENKIQKLKWHKQWSIYLLWLLLVNGLTG